MFQALGGEDAGVSNVRQCRTMSALRRKRPNRGHAANDALCRVSRASPVQTAVRNCTRDGGGPFETGSQVLVSSHRKLLSSKAMVVSVAETSGRDPGRQD